MSGAPAVIGKRRVAEVTSRSILYSLSTQRSAAGAASGVCWRGEQRHIDISCANDILCRHYSNQQMACALAGVCRGNNVFMSF